MVNLNVIAIDLAKNNYQVCKIGKERQVIYNKEYLDKNYFSYWYQKNNH